MTNRTKFFLCCTMGILCSSVADGTTLGVALTVMATGWWIAAFVALFAAMQGGGR